MRFKTKDKLNPGHKPLHAPDPGPPRDKHHTVQTKLKFVWDKNKLVPLKGEDG